MKIIGVIIGILLLAGTVNADVNISTSIYSDGDVNFWANIDTESDANIWIDGISWEDQYGNVTVNKCETSIGTSFSVWDIVNHLEDTAQCALGIKEHCSEWNFRIFNALASVFVTRPEYNDVNNNFDVRLAFLEQTMKVSNAENYCQGKIDVMIERDLEWVKCGNTTFYNTNGKGISVIGG